MKNFDVCVIGSGPGGYVAAIRCAQLGLKTGVVEREKLGGVCLNIGCIPSKAMIGAAHQLHRIQHDVAEMGLEIKGDVKVNMKKMKAWKQSVCDRMSGGVEGLLKGHGVEIIPGEARFVSPKELKITGSSGSPKGVQAKFFIVATGSRPIQIPGFEYDEKTVLSSTGALALESIPKALVVIGGGYIGLEIGSYLAKLGTQVEILEAGPALLSGVVEKDVAQVVSRRLKKNGIKVHLKALAQSYKKSGNRVEVSAQVKGEAQKFRADKILVTVGRQPNSDQLGLQEIGLSLDEKGFVQTDAQRRTTHPHIFAIGDMGQPMLAHKASHEGILVAEVIAGKNRAYDVKTVPSVMFTDPEIAMAGMMETEARKQGYGDLKIAKFPFGANGKAVSMMETEGFVKMIAHGKTHVLLGCHIVGPEASNLISEAALAIEMGATLEDLALTIHPHPTLGETMMEAAEATLGHAIHILQKNR